MILRKKPSVLVFRYPIFCIPRASEKDWRPQEKHWKPTPKAELKSSGILIVSDELSNGKYAIKSTSFGSINNTINTLAHVLIDKLIKATPPEKDIREQVLENFIDYFISEATARFFDDVDAESE